MAPRFAKTGLLVRLSTWLSLVTAAPSECADGTAVCFADNATTVLELGVDVLAAVFGRRPVQWRERRLAYILASIDEAGFGEITRVGLEFADAPPRSLIAKRFLPSSPLAGAHIDVIEHRRHMQSFFVEASVYTNLSVELVRAGLAAPRLLHATAVEPQRPFTLLLEDLTARFPRGGDAQIRRMSASEVAASLRWLAGFHALFWERAPGPDQGLWPRGTYWILDELGVLEMEAVPEGFSNRYLAREEWTRLRAAAVAIDRRLAGRPATDDSASAPSRRHRTLLHGDAKPENVLCSGNDDAATCAALDFAWSGEGYGLCDVMYVLWGELTQAIVDDYLGHYRKELLKRLPGHDFPQRVMQQHLELCVVDFLRWWAGFRGGKHFWAMPWAMDLLRNVLSRLDGGKLLSPDAYCSAVDREFPLD